MYTRTLEENLELTFRQLPTAFAKLVFLATVRDPYTGKYLHEGWTTVGSSEEIHSLLRDTHHEVFEFVCSMPIMRLCGELRGYLRSLSAPWRNTIRLWDELESYREMIPQGVSIEEREFFISQMQVGLAVLTQAPDWAQRELSSWQFLPPAQQLRRHLEN
jgi:hypothetical protein